MAKMKQSMARVAHCTDNGRMEEFWGILKREGHCRHKFTDRQQCLDAISEYIFFYNHRCVQ